MPYEGNDDFSFKVIFVISSHALSRLRNEASSIPKWKYNDIPKERFPRQERLLSAAIIRDYLHAAPTFRFIECSSEKNKSPLAMSGSTNFRIILRKDVRDGRELFSRQLKAPPRFLIFVVGAIITI